MSGTLATKSDIKALGAKMDAGFKVLEAKMDAGFQVMDGKMDAGFRVMDGKMETMITKADLRAAKREMIMWLAGILIAYDVVNATVEGGLINSAVKALIAALGG